MNAFDVLYTIVYMDGWDMKYTVDVCLNAYLIEKHSDRNCKRRILEMNKKNDHTHIHIHTPNEHKLLSRKSEATREVKERERASEIEKKKQKSELR